MELSCDPTTGLQLGSQQDLHLFVATSSAQADPNKIQAAFPIRRHRHLDHHLCTICRLQPWSMPARIQAVESHCSRSLQGSSNLRQAWLCKRKYEP